MINLKYPSKYYGDFCLEMGNTGVISVPYHPPLLCGLSTFSCVGVPRDMKNYFRVP